MKSCLIIAFTFLTTQTFGQTKTNNIGLEELSYEDKVAQKACFYLSKMDSIADPRQAITKVILRATDKVHEEDINKQYTRDWTVEGIRGLNKKVTDLLIENCEIVSKTN